MRCCVGEALKVSSGSGYYIFRGWRKTLGDWCGRDEAGEGEGGAILMQMGREGLVAVFYALCRGGEAQVLVSTRPSVSFFLSPGSGLRFHSVWAYAEEGKIAFLG